MVWQKHIYVFVAWSIDRPTEKIGYVLKLGRDYILIDISCDFDFKLRGVWNFNGCSDRYCWETKADL